MGRKFSRLVLLGGVVASLGVAAPASANPVCVGTQSTVGICVEVTPSTLISDCVYAGPPPCTQVDVPGVSIDCWGWIGQGTEIYC